MAMSKATAQMLAREGEQIVSGRALCLAQRSPSVRFDIETQGARAEIFKSQAMQIFGYGWRNRGNKAQADARLWRVRVEPLGTRRQTHCIVLCEGARHE